MAQSRADAISLIIALPLALLFTSFLLQGLSSILPSITNIMPIGLRTSLARHLGSGSFRPSETEETLFEFSRNTPFGITGYVALDKLEPNDAVMLGAYVALANTEPLPYAKQVYDYDTLERMNSRLVLIEKLPAMKYVKFTIQQVSGTPKPVAWEFYLLEAP